MLASECIPCAAPLGLQVRGTASVRILGRGLLLISLLASLASCFLIVTALDAGPASTISWDESSNLPDCDEHLSNDMWHYTDLGLRCIRVSVITDHLLPFAPTTLVAGLFCSRSCC